MSAWMLTIDGSTFLTSAAIELWASVTGVTVAGAVTGAGAALLPLSVTATMPPATEAPTSAPSAMPAAKRPPLRSRVRRVGGAGGLGGSNAAASGGPGCCGGWKSVIVAILRNRGVGQAATMIRPGGCPLAEEG